MNARDPSTRRSAPSTTPPQEYALLDYAERLDRHRQGRTALHIHLSRLQLHNRREHHIRVALNIFEDLVKQFEGQLFLLANRDVVFICKGARQQDLEQAIQRLRYLFSEDPLTRFADDLNDDGGFCTWYALERDYTRFLALAKRIHDGGGQDRPANSGARQPPRPTARPLTPRLLAKLVEVLETADLSSLVRNQPVCSLAKGQTPEAVFYEMYVSIGDLERLSLPDVSMTADPWLFKYLTQTLDKRMLSQVMRDNRSGDLPFSMNLNVATILSPEFQKFDQSVPSTIRGRLVVELQKVDLFADMGAYLFARDYLRERGYRICLDGLTHLTLPYIDRERLGIDLLKMYWSSELVRGMQPEALAALEGTIKQSGRSRFILCRCDSETAVAFGQKMGITLFQGRYLDQELRRRRPVTERLGSLRY